ncbi:Mn2+/Zn2+ transporter ATP-binding protein [Neoasaia chiangmaiensis NBRC 101099]|uniref:Uncharacterized protein n=1 Tax=Neoasaia chiangmaiensis TaxID=320497 RepID=A0A1U9KPL0_9PROT|nr:ATP-binding cassette domain-containing protein [Neoasaia chiangmaiensis]AQS87761.1 hypothetical protein A0U93_07220 [Neoasaia chiangmaiensis]GBR41646.1 Mn2+/Zn2+ transporter ATP-binding protein [Neoasaia chiangmaiensis NBRC 101099]GEN14358.1 ABC transporter ATP-binding protein [Neoasaia chiangmaiensis]
MTNAVVFHDVTLRQGARVLVRHVSLALPAGAFALLRGANGTGKTTLLRTLMGLHPVAEGHITILNAPPAQARQRIGYLPQMRQLPAPQLEGRALVAAAWRGTRWGLPVLGRTGRAAVDRALRLADAEKLARQPVAQLSGGERQRLALAQTLLNQPPLLLLDEPLAGLDTERQVETATLLGRLHRESDMTILVSVHGETALDRFATHEIILEGASAALRDARI